MRNLDIFNIGEATDVEINKRLTYLEGTVDVLEQAMTINRNCHRLMEGDDYDTTMIKWTMQAKFEKMQRDWGNAINELFYIQDLQERSEQFNRDIKDAIEESLIEQSMEQTMHDAWLDEVQNYNEHELDLYYDAQMAYDELEDKGHVDNPALDYIDDDDLPF